VKLTANPGRSVEITAALRIGPVGSDTWDSIFLDNRELPKLLRENLAELPEEADGSDALWRRRVRLTVEVLG
jgi:hypothetical protein